jgi:hypothetical protein
MLLFRENKQRASSDVRVPNQVLSFLSGPCGHGLVDSKVRAVASTRVALAHALAVFAEIDITITFSEALATVEAMAVVDLVPIVSNFRIHTVEPGLLLRLDAQNLTQTGRKYAEVRTLLTYQTKRSWQQIIFGEFLRNVSVPQVLELNGGQLRVLQKHLQA